MPGYSLKQSMLSGFLDAAKLRKVSPSPPDNWPNEENSSRRISSAGRYVPFCHGRNKACRPSHSQASRMLNEPPAKACVDDTSNCGGKINCDDGEHDLAAMVCDFIENGSNAGDDRCALAENGASGVVKLEETLQALVSSVSSLERDLLRAVTAALASANERDFACGSCNGGSCVRRAVVKPLKLAGYNAALCKIKWTGSGRVPGGEYEYIDVIPDRAAFPSDRLIIDTDFRSQFEIARPVPQYQAALRALPTIFIGRPAKLEQILQIMSKAAKCSLKQNSMPLPPWRTLEYMKAKWLSAFERTDGDSVVPHQREPLASEVPGSKPCAHHLVRLKTFLKDETEVGLTKLKSITNRGKIFPRVKSSYRS